MCKKFSSLLCMAVLSIAACNGKGGNDSGAEPSGGQPSIQVSRVPEYGDLLGRLEGSVRGVNTKNHYVAVFLRVDSWWTKPFWDKPKTAIAGNGDWSCDVVTGGVDHRAVGYAAFLLPNDYYPPSLGGGGIPEVIFEHALDSTFVARDATGHSPLERPTGVTADPIDPAADLGPFSDLEMERSVEIRWRYGNRDNVDGFNVFARENYDDKLILVATADRTSDAISFTHRAGGRRCFQVHAANGVGDSDPSRETCIYFSEIPIAASYTPHGLCFSPFSAGQDPNSGDVLSPEQVGDHVKFIRQYTRRIRTYGTAGGLAIAGEYAHRYDLEIAMGAWIGPDLDANRGELDRLLAAAGRGEVDAAIVGSEVLERGDLPAAQLLLYMEEFRAAYPDIPLTTADTSDMLLAHPEIVAACDVVFAHLHPYWAGVHFDDAVYWLDRRYRELQVVSGGKEIVVAETGWPSAGAPQGHAVPSIGNASYYFKNFVTWARAKNVEFFYFEALDEPWKVEYEPNSVGAHWGILGEDLVLKEGCWDIYRGMTSEDNWTRTIPCGQESEPKLAISHVPPYGSFAYDEYLEGSTCGVWPGNHGVTAYIKTESGWWTKPYLDTSVSALKGDGTFSVDITTDANDYKATAVAVFLIRRDALPPILEGAEAIPKWLFDEALDSVMVDRPAPPP